jgi:hypothetical protein
MYMISYPLVAQAKGNHYLNYFFWNSYNRITMFMQMGTDSLS